MATTTAQLKRTYNQLFIDGSWVTPSSDRQIQVINPYTEEVVGTVPSGGGEDVERAVAAAKAAFPSWSATPLEERLALCSKVGELLAANSGEIAAVICAELGMPLRLCELIQVGLPTTTFRSMAEVAPKVEWEERVGNSIVLREPVGVVAAITPWNYPLHQIAAKVAPALAAGCTVVLKPSGVAPLNAFILAELIEQAGFPPGVFNLVSGGGREVGEALASHPDVDMVSFTGSTAVGRRVTELAAKTIKRVAMELGGKSANVILEDADLAKAVPDGVAKCFLNSGQTCSALTRMVVPRRLLGEVEELAAQAAATYRLGDPFDPETRLGPLVSADQRQIVRSYIEKGVAEGAKLVCGGPEPPQQPTHGYFVQPTVFSEVEPGQTIAQEEIFGPVLSIIPYDTEEEAVEIANGTIYGLAGGVWSGDRERAIAVAKRLRTGQVEINGGAFNPLAPFGGYKQSGNGRELGRHGVEEFLELKALQL
jgi:aldehyde dehydrogenase (NAD+)